MESMKKTDNRIKFISLVVAIFMIVTGFVFLATKIYSEAEEATPSELSKIKTEENIQSNSDLNESKNPKINSSYSTFNEGSKIGIAGNSFYEIFADRALAEYIAWMNFGIGDANEILTQEMADSLTTLDLYQRFASDYSGIEVFRNLDTLDLTYNDLVALPEVVFEFENLEYLYLTRNQLESLPENFGELSKLQELTFYGNNLKRLPESFGDLAKLRHLEAGENQLERLPDSFGKLTSLKFADFTYNNITELPDSIMDLDNITNFQIGFNKLHSLPENFGGLEKLLYLGLGNNLLTKLPESFLNLPSAVIVSIENNQLTSLPDGFLDFRPTDFVRLDKNLLPTDFYEVLKNSNVPIRDWEYDQDKIELIDNLQPILIHDKNSLDKLNYSNLLKLETGGELSSKHIYRLENIVDENDQAIDINSFFENGVVVKQGKVFANVRATGSGIFPNTSDNAITNKKIEFNFVIKYFNLSFDLNGGQGETPVSQKIIAGQRANEPQQPERAEFTFLEWNTQKDGNGNVWDFQTSTMPEKDVTLYAQWTSVDKLPVEPQPPINPENPVNPENPQTYVDDLAKKDQESFKGNFNSGLAQNKESQNEDFKEADLDLINDKSIPLYGKNAAETWAIANIIITILSIIFVLISIFDLFKKKRPKKTTQIISSLVGLATLIVFLITANFNGIMVIFNFWSIVLGIMLIIQIVALAFASHKKEEEQQQSLQN